MNSHSIRPPGGSGSDFSRQLDQILRAAASAYRGSLSLEIVRGPGDRSRIILGSSVFYPNYEFPSAELEQLLHQQISESLSHCAAFRQSAPPWIQQKTAEIHQSSRFGVLRIEFGCDARDRRKRTLRFEGGPTYLDRYWEEALSN
ncbi:MAG: hypothetical protein HC771_18595 [Synechococcales cyanobacterium CRU_2_2]|nr:hypothetical protein [Synechococcales cyanobacterium CRU_2_2]